MPPAAVAAQVCAAVHRMQSLCEPIFQICNVLVARVVAMVGVGVRVAGRVPRCSGQMRAAWSATWTAQRLACRHPPARPGRTVEPSAMRRAGRRAGLARLLSGRCRVRAALRPAGRRRSGDRRAADRADIAGGPAVIRLYGSRQSSEAKWVVLSNSLTPEIWGVMFCSGFISKWI
ncbi:hypothetical protein XAPC_1337 [Xanthomonas citri pv. punicae str. LMG 859]|nr:hypothetical protein XAPC_1337 [Xanthomonas citri pv. punicae str. LMG 859]